MASEKLDLTSQKSALQQNTLVQKMAKLSGMMPQYYNWAA